MSDYSFLMNNEKHYITIDNYCKHKFNKKTYKVSLNGNFSCPNRDGSLSNKGCIFCSEKGSGDFAGDKTKPLDIQFNEIKEKMKKKWPDGYYIAYFQANTNTYGTIEKLKDTYSKIITDNGPIDPNIKVLSIATRPDCINTEIVQYLKELNSKIEVWVELGFQTSNEETAALINRGYDNHVFINAVNLLKANSIKVIVHIINGLPYETKEDMLNTTKLVNSLGVDGIKIHMLHIMKNTPLEEYYGQNKFKVLSLQEYVDIVVEEIRNISTSTVIHRLTGDAPKDLLIEPLWTLKKLVVMNEIDKTMRKYNYYQGDLCSK